MKLNLVQKWMIAGMIIMAIGGLCGKITHYTQKDWGMYALVIFSLGLVVSAYGAYLGKNLDFEKSLRPRVRVWAHNGVTAVCAEEDYQRWWLEHCRYELLARSRGISLPPEKPSPRFIMFFSDIALAPKNWSDALGRSLDDFKTGTMKECGKLLEGCQVEKSELFIPQSPYEWNRRSIMPVLFKEAWVLVHGPEAEIPV